MKTIKIPSKAVLTLLTAVCVLMGVEPKMVKREGKYTQYDEDYWSPSTSNKVLANTQLIDILSNFDPKKMDPETMRRVAKVTNNDEFTL